MKLKVTRSEFFLLIISVVLTVFIALTLVRQLAPALLGLPADFVLVNDSEEIPPFYENIFRKSDLESKEFILKDPIVKGRAKPMFPDLGLVGPNDLLGFRNLAVPNSADIIVIGDSQTYGNNAVIWENWPHQLQEKLPEGESVYSMATGGWGALQYFYAFAKALNFKPKVIIVAFYTGNDSLETFSLALASDIWTGFLPKTNLTKYDAPKSKFPPPASDMWHVEFSDGIKAIFTPKLRSVSNMSHPAIDYGYSIMLNIASVIGEKANEKGIDVIFTIIPTKEYVYSEKIKEDRIKTIESYDNLIRDEGYRIKNFSNQLMRIEKAHYVDVVKSLKIAAMNAVPLYPADDNGHPVAAGYRIIADKIAPVVSKLISPPPDGFAINITPNNIRTLIFINRGKFWIVEGPGDLIKEKFKEKRKKLVSSREISGLIYRGHIDINSIKLPN